MTDFPGISDKFVKRVPWNKGKILGRSRHFAPSTFGRFGPSFKLKVEFAIWRCSTWQSAANFVVAT